MLSLMLPPFSCYTT